MSRTRIIVAVAISLPAFLLPAKAAASDRPVLISHVTSPPVRDMPPQARRNGPLEEKPVRRPASGRSSGAIVDPVVQTSTTTVASAQALGQWEGMGAGYPGFSITAVPPDPNIAVGPNHIVQWVNNAFVVFDKLGNVVNPPVSDDTFWGSLSGTCDQLGGYSDPVVQYDRVADRWIVGEVAIPLFPGLIGQFAQCFAVSKTSDPTGAYNQWTYGFGTAVPDYPKIGMWPDGYYVTWNIFEGGATFTGAETCAWDRVGMLSGVAAPKFVCFKLTSAFASLLPADFDGPVPPSGSPNFLMNIDPGSSSLNLWKFHVDFATPKNSTLVGPISIPGTAPFVAPCPDTQDCIPQPGTTESLDALGDRLMYRLAYRNFGDHESIVANHTVVAGSGATGVRWYEVRNPNSAPAIYQQGTFAPDADNRWMASIAMDRTGNIGVGYSVASGGTFPSIRYTGWEVGNPLGMLQDETFFVAGGGSQTGYNRWGDYSAMRIDPTDDCTFWYTQEYQATTQVVAWSTRIGSFRFASCGQSLASTTTTVTSSLPSSLFGQSVTFTASVSPSAATGTVQFFDGAVSLGTASLSGGSASLTTAALAVGTHSITATYSGDANFATSTSSAFSQTVSAAGTTTALTSSLNPSPFGQQVAFTATVSPSSGPTGTVQFFDGVSSLGTAALSGGSASLTTSALAVGTHSITARYSGDANFTGSTSAALAQTVSPVSTATALTSSLDPSVFGQQVTFTATVSPTSGPTGTVQFFDGVNSLGTAALSGSTASITTSALAVGTHFITASYSGDTTYSGSTSASLVQTVNVGTVNTTTTLTSSLNPSAYGQQVMFTATVGPSAGASGTVTFMDGGSTIGTSALNASGVATLSISSLAVGTHSITAQYSGDGTHSSSASSPLSQTVNQAGTTTTLTSSANPSKSGSAVTLTARVSPTSATGSVQFFDGSTSLGTMPVSSGVASLTTSTLGGGKHSITAVYSGDANFAGSTSAVLSQTVTGKK
jgi:Bacterial Ig-like domain (group 3)